MTKKVIATIVLFIIVLFLLKNLLNIYAADYFYKRSQTLIEDGDFKTSVKYADYAINLNPHEPNYYRGRAKILVTMLTNQTDRAHDVKLSAVNDLTIAYNLNPQNLVVSRNSIPLYYFIATKDLTQPASLSNLDEDFLIYAKEFYNLLKQRYPNDLGVMVQIAKYEKRLGLDSEYLETTERIKTLRPDVLEWYKDL